MIEIKHAKKRYKDFELDLSLALPAGQILGVIGANGAGKSTLFKSILGLVGLDEGEIVVFDQNVHTLPIAVKERIGVVMPESTFSEELDPSEIEKILDAMYSRFDKEFYQTWLAKFKLDPKKPIKELSTGQKAKLKIVIALSHQADLLILDEPTSGLDVFTRNEILDLLRSFMEDEAHSILISSHISSDLSNLCDKIVLLDEGKILLKEDLDTLLSNYAIIQIFEETDLPYILRKEKTPYGYRLLTDQKQFYIENYPQIDLEKADLDDILTMFVQGECL